MHSALLPSLLPHSVEVSASSTGAGILVILLSLAYLALFISALVSITRSSAYTTGVKALWILACFITPFIGSIVWFVWGRRG